jgi:Sec7-like guanine-nucleotide exchange factor
MLNTDLHAPALRNNRRMRVDQFADNVRGVPDCRHLDKCGFICFFKKKMFK